MNTRTFQWIFLLLSLSIVVACKNQQKVSKDPGGQLANQKNAPKDSAVIIISRGACYGKCPVYTMMIYANGRAHFEGRMFVSKLGIYEKDLGVNLVDSLVNSFEQAGIWNMKTQYPSLASDLPDAHLTFRHKGKSISISGVYNAPQSLKDILKALYDIGDSDGWNKVGDLPAGK